MQKQKIAIIGSGISGISAAYFLSKNYDVHLYEQKSYLGGHTRTILVNENNQKIPIDTGFIVFNKSNYPDLVSFFAMLKVKYKNSNMSFSVSNKNSEIEYSGKNLIGLFANPKNIFSLKYLKMLREIHKFYYVCNNIELSEDLNHMTLINFLDLYKFSDYLRRYHIYPMISSIWSTNQEDVKRFPFILFINFFKNHGLFNLNNRPQWKYVEDGSNNYIKKILNLNLFSYNNNFKIKKVLRDNSSITIIDQHNQKKVFDKVVIATHADQALSLIDNPTKNEKKILSVFKYTKNDAYLHSDINFMPKRKLAWSSWNFMEYSKKTCKFTLTYWMNLLQNLESTNNYFVTINPEFHPLNVVDKTTFEHPVFSMETLKAQKNSISIQGNLNTFYCGSYLGYGFHEDGIQSAAYIAKLLKVDLPWPRDENFYNRLQVNISI